ncbi:hypothetical protein EYF80_020653 [Liparis tanakae]|uniref:Uncharacterized protein n=1 Tax=Liparis tanakae TaxID=230148 RepID=A0A4Z2HTT9_9TELE|nr:hypothetical protein EYF80_020653 [Liparis tanakae]
MWMRLGFGFSLLISRPSRRQNLWSTGEVTHGERVTEQSSNQTADETQNDALMMYPDGNDTRQQADGQLGWLSEWEALHTNGEECDIQWIVI